MITQNSNYGTVRPFTSEERRMFNPIISDFNGTTGASLNEESVATMSTMDSEELIGYHLLN